MLDNSFGFVVLPTFLFAVAKDTTSNVTVGGRPRMLLYASTDDDVFRAGNFPIDLSTSSQITILDRSDVIILALWLGQSWADVYVSDADGFDYTLMINRVRRRDAHKYDFYNPRGVDGDFFVNQVDVYDLSKWVTLRTNDKGAIWRQLQGPSVTDGIVRNCSQPLNCALHFQFIAGLRPVTSEHAIGMLLVQGNVG